MASTNTNIRMENIMDIRTYRRNCWLGALGAALMITGDLCLSVILATPSDSGLFYREAYLGGGYLAWRLPLLVATGLLGMALCYFTVWVSYMQIQPEYRRTRRIISICGVIYLTSAGVLHFMTGMALLALCNAWAVLKKQTILPQKMFLLHMVVWQIVFVCIPDIRQMLGTEVSTWDFVLSQCSGNVSLLIWMVANALWAAKTPA